MSHLRRHLPLLALLLAAALLLFWRLGAVYLWQDEAATAVMAERLAAHGRPLAYEGSGAASRNVITMDVIVEDNPHTLAARATDPGEAIRYYAQRGDFRADGTWVNQPWGQFVAAAASLSLLGHGTAAARAPFALAGLLTVLLLYLLARRTFEDRWLALAAVALLVANAYWILHARQCRYYALSSLGLLGTVGALERWLRGARWGAALFVAAGWLLFHCDYGTFFPAMAVLALAAAASRWPRLGEPAAVFAALAAVVAPFAWYYGLLSRVRRPFATLAQRVAGTLFNVNQYVIALPLLLAAAWLLWRHRAALLAPQRRVLAVCAGIVLALLAWVPGVVPWSSHRYVVQATPLAALVAAWTIARLADALAALLRRPRAERALAVGLLVLVGGTGLLSAPGAWALLRVVDMPTRHLEPLWRPELGTMVSEVFLERLDPNREAIEAIAPRLRPGDEILVNYEDIPFMFYTAASIRGGVPAFRLEDRSAPPPRFLVVRSSVSFVHWAAFKREWERYAWREIPSRAPDVPWGNNPDPTSMPLRATDRRVAIGERVGP